MGTMLGEETKYTIRKNLIPIELCSLNWWFGLDVSKLGVNILCLGSFKSSLLFPC